MVYDRKMREHLTDEQSKFTVIFKKGNLKGRGGRKGLRETHC